MGTQTAMAILAPALFVIAAIVAIGVIRRSVLRAAPMIRALRTDLKRETLGRPIEVRVLETRDDLGPEAESLPRPTRHPRPKPVTHRRHHFPRPAQAA